MPDKKPTDNEIVKAFGEMVERGFEAISYVDKNKSVNVITITDILDLINRQKEYIKKCDNLERIADKTIETQKAEIEDIKFLYENLKEEHLEIIKAIKHTKSEAYKEFAEKLEERIAVHLLKNKSNQYAEGFADALDGVNGEIDNLLKELIGE